MGFIRNLDTGMRRLGFLDVLISDCITPTELMDANTLGSRLWDKIRDKQLDWLQELARRRGLKNEVGRLSPATAARYVKLASELGFLTEGPNKSLSDLGKTFGAFRRSRFYLDENPGQRLLYLREIVVRKDSLIIPGLFQFISSKLTVDKDSVFEWFANKFANNIDRNGSVSDSLRVRLKNTSSLYATGVSRKKAKDRIKHMVETRLEQLVDLVALTKREGPIYSANELGKRLATKLSTDEEFYKTVGDFFGAIKLAGTIEITKKILFFFQKLAQPPLNLVPIAMMHDLIIISSMISDGSVVLPTDLDNVERALARKFYGNVVFFEGSGTKATHVTITDVKAIEREL